jgi:hypothetical protein
MDVADARPLHDWLESKSLGGQTIIFSEVLKTMIASPSMFGKKSMAIGDMLSLLSHSKDWSDFAPLLANLLENTSESEANRVWIQLSNSFKCNHLFFDKLKSGKNGQKLLRLGKICKSISSTFSKYKFKAEGTPWCVFYQLISGQKGIDSGLLIKNTILSLISQAALHAVRDMERHIKMFSNSGGIFQQ